MTVTSLAWALLPLAVAVALVARGRSAHRHYVSLTAAPQMTSAQVIAALDGEERVPCAVAGTALPGPVGTYTSPLTQTECVWYRLTFPNSGLSTRESHGVFGLQDATGNVLVTPHAANFAQVDKTENDDVSYAGQRALGVERSSSYHTSQLSVTEQVIAVGTELYVVGEAVSSPDGPCVGASVGHKSVISAWPIEHAIRGVGRRTGGAYVGAGIAVMFAIMFALQPLIEQAA